QVAVAVQLLERQRARAGGHEGTGAVLERELHRHRVRLTELRAGERREEPHKLVLAHEDCLRWGVDLTHPERGIVCGRVENLPELYVGADAGIAAVRQARVVNP